jgi:hypothetical protein
VSTKAWPMVDEGRVHGRTLSASSSLSVSRCVSGWVNQGAAGRRPTVSAEARPAPWSDRRYAGVCQRTLSCVVFTAPMEALTGDAVGGVRRHEPLIFITYLGPVISRDDSTSR